MLNSSHHLLELLAQSWFSTTASGFGWVRLTMYIPSLAHEQYRCDTDIIGLILGTYFSQRYSEMKE